MRRKQALKLLREHKQEFEDRYGITRLGIFGSVARDEAGERSDVDVVVEMPPDMFARVILKEELEMILRSKVDVVRYWRRMNQYLKRRIDREAYYV
ncbi:MAG: nucleotidyltransferase family protein [Methanosarcinales archaeon]|nr:nucleotidyltransferase family protein [Methanosarcinales archaeon]MCD4816561.1 nucleotidyltransferase family protein [Methanosarcinales archaeon]